MQKKGINWLWFRADEPETIREWEHVTSEALSACIGHTVNVGIVLPTKERARLCFANNLDLRGRIIFSDDDEHGVSIELHLPFDGVFIYANKMGGGPHVKVWNSWLESDEHESEKGKGKIKRGKRKVEINAETDLLKTKINTFPYWLKKRVCLRFKEVLDKRRKDDPRVEWFSTSVMADMSHGLLLDDAMMRIDPQNAIQLIGTITGVRRFWINRGAAERISIERRQNHKSFEGRICPIETPESEMVGLALQLARGARVNSEGRIIACEFDGKNVGDMLSWGTSLIPFSHNNDGARNMMGAKNLRQAVALCDENGVFSGECPVVKSGAENALAEKMADLVDIGLCPRCQREGKFAPGRNLLVAYMPWHGWNVDDAVVISESCSRSMGMKVSKRISKWLDSGWKLAGGKLQAVEVGTVVAVKSGDVLAELLGPQGQKKIVRYGDARPGHIVCLARPASGDLTYPRKLEYVVEKHIPLGVGDKVMGRHGNKGVVAKVLPDTEMPSIPSDESIPECYRGRPVDVLLNPNGVLSRMNPGQLLETHLGWILGAEPRRETTLVQFQDYAVGAPIKGQVWHKEVRKLLESGSFGVNGGGALTLNMPNGERTRNPIVVGLQYFFRLNHVPELKAQARRGGANAHYATNTLQAPRGRLNGGGQRVGEMEVWALAAHSAYPVLTEMLGEKSNAFDGNGCKDLGCMEHGFFHVLRDKFRAMCVDANIVDGQMKLSWLNHKSHVIEICGGVSHQVVSPSHDFGVFKAFAYECPKCQEMLAGGRVFPGVFQGKGDYLTIDRLLAGLGLVIRDVAVNAHEADYFILKVEDIDTHKRFVEFSLHCETEAKTSVKAVLRPVEREGNDWLKTIWPMQASSREGERFAEVHCYVANSKATSAKEILDRLGDVNAVDYIGNYKVTCGCHQTTPLKAVPESRIAAGRAEISSPGGIFDRKIFGSILNPLGTYERDAWGYIELPHPVGVPVGAFDSRAANSSAFIRVVPVLPLRYRMPSVANGRIERIGALNESYVGLIKECGKGDPSKISSAVAAIIRTVADEFRGGTSGEHKSKDGLIRKYGLGRRVDRSFRLVITPDPELDWDQVGVPFDVLWEVMGDVVVNSCGYDAAALIDHHDISVGWDWHKLESPISDQDARNLLQKYLDDNPKTYILLNRQPSLHRDSFQAFKPVILRDGSEPTLHLSPLCCKGFGADFDGDEMVGHYPLSKAAQNCAAALSPSHNPLSAATGTCLANFDRDFVIGLYQLLKDETGKHDLETLLSREFCTETARVWIAELAAALCPGENPSFVRRAIFKDKAGDVLTQISKRGVENGKPVVNVISRLARMAYDSCTDQGASFGFYDLLDLSVNCEKSGTDDESVRNWVFERLWQSVGGDHRAGVRAVAEMVLSGANGAKQIHQIIGARGELSGSVPGKDGTVFNDCNLIEGMDWNGRSSYFSTSWNARNSMCEKKLSTAKAGYLTRRLVLALWPIKIVEEDCSAETPDIESCKAIGGICQKCYGKLADGKYAPIGYPAGLIAAQSLGERGTQLSMKSAHSGGNEFNIGAVNKILNKKDPFWKGRCKEEQGVGPGKTILKWDRFLKLLKDSVYGELQERHMKLVWRAIEQLKEREKGCDSLRSIAGKDKFTRLVIGNPLKAIFEVIENDRAIDLDSPFAKVVFNSLGSGEVAHE